MTEAEVRLIKEHGAFKKRKAVLAFAREYGQDAEAYKLFNVPHSTFYRWKKAYEAEGEAGLRRKKPEARHHPPQVAPRGGREDRVPETDVPSGPQRITC